MRKRLLVSVCVVLNCIFAVLLLCAVLIPKRQKTALYTNLDVSSYDTLDEIPVIGAVTNNRNAEFTFRLYGEELYGICLYFFANGSGEGTLKCTLQYGENSAVREIPVSELTGSQNTDSLVQTELVFDDVASYSGEYTLLIEGRDIMPDTQISFYANEVSDGVLHYENDLYQDYYGVLYVIESTEKAHPYVWCTSFILAMGLLVSYIICTDFGEKQNGKAEKI